jgi:hypothetical protein
LSNEDEYLKKAKVFASELGLRWEQVIDAVEMCNYIRAVTLEWLYEHRGLLEMSRFKEDINGLHDVVIDKRMQAYCNLGYELPAAIKRHPRLFFDFWDMLRSLLKLHTYFQQQK